MKYFLKNIAQKSLMRTILLVLIGLSMWIVSTLNGNGVVTGMLGITLVIINSLLITQSVCRIGWTNLPSGFVAATSFLLLSALSIWNLCWQVHIVMLEYTIATTLFARMNIQEEAKEQAYLLTLLCCVLSPHLYVIVVGVLYILFYLLTRSHFTWRVFVAILLAISTYVLYAAIFRYFGWWETLWLENLPKLPWQWCLIGIGVYVYLFLMLLFPLKRPSISSGIIYVLGILGTIASFIFFIFFSR